MFAKILLPLDGSSLAEYALPPALALAQQSEGTIIVLRCVEPEQMLVPDSHMLGGYSVLWPNQSRELARKESTAYLKHLRETRFPRGVVVQTELVDGGAADIIVDRARLDKVDLIAMSSHGYSGVTRWMLGSVAERVLHDAACPVLVVRSPDPIRHILIALDGSPLSEQIIEPAFALATALHCKVTLLRAVEPFTHNEYQYLETLESNLGQRMIDDIHATAETYLHSIATAHERTVPELKTVVMHDAAASGILAYGQTHNVDLIAMSTHGRTGLSRWVYGSVTEKVLRAANCCSMLVVRPSGQRAH